MLIPAANVLALFQQRIKGAVGEAHRSACEERGEGVGAFSTQAWLLRLATCEGANLVFVGVKAAVLVERNNSGRTRVKRHSLQRRNRQPSAAETRK